MSTNQLIDLWICLAAVAVLFAGACVFMAGDSLVTDFIESRRTYPFIAHMNAKRKGARYV